MARIHATALVERQAELGDDVEVAAYAVIGAHVRIDEGTRIGPHHRCQSRRFQSGIADL